MRSSISPVRPNPPAAEAQIPGERRMGGTVRNHLRMHFITFGALFALFLGMPCEARERKPAVGPDDATLHLYNLLDSRFDGKLKDFCLLGDIVSDPKNPGEPQQHILCTDYDKARGFGKLQIHVRTVAQPTPEQLKAYTPKQIYDFAESDDQRFTKSDPGPMGAVGDVYVVPTQPGGPLASAAITPEVQAQYERYVTQYLMPALEKKVSGGN